MADLIIKPSSGNNLVVQGGDSSPAITVANTGTTTFAENATMSGTLGVTGNTTLSGTANNLGTVTAGSIAGGSITSATTFPVGHIIKTTEVFPSDYSISNYSEQTSPYYSSTQTVSMTSGNKMLITWQGTIMRSTATNTHHTYMGITGTGLSGTLNSAAGRPQFLSHVTHYRWATNDTYSNGTAIILTDVINATSGAWGVFFAHGTGGTGTTFSLSSQIVVFQEIQQ